jgi:putative ABC transport system substrate-binding protein
MGIMSKRLVSAAAVMVGLATPCGSWSQDARKVWRVGILWHASTLEQEEAFFRPFAEGMRELGYVEGRNVFYDHTFVDEKYDRFAARTQELVDRRADIIVASIAAAAIGARKVTTSIPVVFATAGDPVKVGLAESLSHPGGNATGLTLFYPEISARLPQLLRQLLPGLTRMGVLWNPTNADHAVGLKEIEESARLLNLQLVRVPAKGPEEFPDAFAAMAKEKVGGFVVLGDAMFRIYRKEIIAQAAARKLPGVYGPRDFAVDGGLITSGVPIPLNFRRTASFVDRIIKGAKPGDLPVERPTRLELVINMKTARALDIVVPQALLLTADEVIE